MLRRQLPRASCACPSALFGSLWRGPAGGTYHRRSHQIVAVHRCSDGGCLVPLARAPLPCSAVFGGDRRGVRLPIPPAQPPDHPPARSSRSPPRSSSVLVVLVAVTAHLWRPRPALACSPFFGVLAFICVLAHRWRAPRPSLAAAPILGVLALLGALLGALRWWPRPSLA